MKKEKIKLTIPDMLHLAQSETTVIVKWRKIYSKTKNSKMKSEIGNRSEFREYFIGKIISLEIFADGKEWKDVREICFSNGNMVQPIHIEEICEIQTEKEVFVHEHFR